MILLSPAASARASSEFALADAVTDRFLHEEAMNNPG